MSQNHAVIIQKPGEAQVEEDSIPKLRDDYILVKTKAVALNPTNWKHVDFLTSKGAREIGCDYAGIVEEVGSKVTNPFKRGDRVCGLCNGDKTSHFPSQARFFCTQLHHQHHAGNEVHHEDGSFREYIAAKGDIQIQIPDNLSFEEAATLGMGTTTAGQGLYQSLQLPLPNKPTAENAYFLIYGEVQQPGVWRSNLQSYLASQSWLPTVLATSTTSRISEPENIPPPPPNNSDH